jgi:hypothetical protein
MRPLNCRWRRFSEGSHVVCGRITGTRDAHTTAVASTTAVVPAAGDEVSAAIASLFSSQGARVSGAQRASPGVPCPVGAGLDRCDGGVHSDRGRQRGGAGDSRGQRRPAPCRRQFLTTLVKETIGRPKLLEPVKELDGKAKRLLDLIPKIPVPKKVSTWEKEIQARVAAREQKAAANWHRIDAILKNGVKLVATDGTAVYIDGQAFVKHVRVFANGELSPRLLHLHPGLSARNIDIVIRNKLKLDDVNFVKALHGSQLHVLARGEGYAQTVLRAVSNELYRIEFDVAGRVLHTVRLR